MEMPDEQVVRRYELTTEKLFMTPVEAVVLARELASRLSSMTPKPQVVVGIADGALLISHVAASALNVPMLALRIQRKGTTWKRRLERIPGLRRLFSLLYALPLMKASMAVIIRRFEKLETPSRERDALAGVAGKTVALIDDCIESGQTIVAARDRLAAAGAAQILVACISWSRLREQRADGSSAPDVFINRRLQHYPWSGNSPHWSEHGALLAKLGLVKER